MGTPAALFRGARADTPSNQHPWIVVPCGLGDDAVGYRCTIGPYWPQDLDRERHGGASGGHRIIRCVGWLRRMDGCGSSAWDWDSDGLPHVARRDRRCCTSVL